MTRQSIISKTVAELNQLPENKLQEVHDFVLFLKQRYEDSLLTQEIQKLSQDSKTFDFLAAEEDLYSASDLKKVYNG